MLKASIIEFDLAEPPSTSVEAIFVLQFVEGLAPIYNDDKSLSETQLHVAFAALDVMLVRYENDSVICRITILLLETRGKST